jgi:hypothetical protein
MKYLLFALLFAVSSLQAATFNVTWNAATERVDGTPFNMATDGLGYHVWFDGVQEINSDGDPVLLHVGANELSRVVPSGTELCIALSTVPKQGDESDPSPETCKTYFAKAGMPSNLTITIVPD